MLPGAAGINVRKTARYAGRDSDRLQPGDPSGARCVKPAGRKENAMSDESCMHAAGESHDCVVPAKAPNKGPQGSAEGLEGRRSIMEIPRHGPMLDTVPKNRVH